MKSLAYSREELHITRKSGSYGKRVKDSDGVTAIDPSGLGLGDRGCMHWEHWEIQPGRCNLRGVAALWLHGCV